MKNLLFSLLLLISYVSYGQSAKSNTISIVRNEIEKTAVITDIIPDFPSDCNVTSFELVNKVGDHVLVNTGNNKDLFILLKDNLKSSNLKSKAYLDLKMMCDKKSKVKTYCFLIKG
jgi:hypothetical protein